MYPASTVAERTALLHTTALEAMQLYGTDITQRMYLVESSIARPGEVAFCATVPPGSTGEHIADELRRRAMITASHETADNVCRVHLALSDGMGEILNLQMLCGGEEQAEKLEENFRKNAEKYYTQIMELLSRDEKV